MQNAKTPNTLTFAELAALKPCDLPARKALFADAERLDARQALAAGASVSDLLWVAGRLGLTDQCVTFAIRCAEAVAHLNADPRAADAIAAAKACQADPSHENAAAASYAAAYAAARTAAATAATYAARTAARAAAADAAAAAYAAARAAAAAAAAATYAAAAARVADVTAIFLDVFNGN